MGAEVDGGGVMGMLQGVTPALMGMSVQISPDRPRYVLPEELMPGVPWPEGFRDSINTWARGFFKGWNLMEDGQVISTNNTLFMNPRTEAALMSAIKTTNLKANHDL